MTDYATPNLPSRNFDATQRFYGSLGFTPTYVDDGWLIMTRSGITLEFFLHVDLDPLTSWFSCCLRVDDTDAIFDAFIAAGIGQDTKSHPCIYLPKMQPFGLKMGAMIDIDGTLLRVIENER
ncbi:bleomycin resistance protein [Rahnella sp. AA]|uniref:bleomycin resistance protein n=1 Tax=Rahnella sp. AA TaxID=2057180 RepID=UPI000C331D89|nr:bleomycin resistance protein [Rahnella sp. AA]PKE31053.1 bleomycin resistance protein [Rahnella sp. AA]